MLAVPLTAVVLLAGCPRVLYLDYQPSTVMKGSGPIRIDAFAYAGHPTGLMKENELQGVLKALRAAHIDIVAIHNHMTGEDPRVMFLHYWGIGPAADLAKGLKAALDTQAK